MVAYIQCHNHKQIFVSSSTFYLHQLQSVEILSCFISFYCYFPQINCLHVCLCGACLELLLNKTLCSINFTFFWVHLQYIFIPPRNFALSRKVCVTQYILCSPHNVFAFPLESLCSVSRVFHSTKKPLLKNQVLQTNAMFLWVMQNVWKQMLIFLGECATFALYRN